MPEHPAIFIVDDDPGIRSALGMLADCFGWQSQSFASAEAFLDTYTPGDGHCLIVDVNLSGMSGADLLAELNARRVGVPAVVITALPDSDIARAAAAAGAIAVLTKPFKSAELLPLVERAVRDDHDTEKPVV